MAGVTPASVRLSPVESVIVVPAALLEAYDNTAARSWAWLIPGVRYQNDDAANWIVSGVRPVANPSIVSLPKFAPKSKVSGPTAPASIVSFGS